MRNGDELDQIDVDKSEPDATLSGSLTYLAATLPELKIQSSHSCPSNTISAIITNNRPPLLSLRCTQCNPPWSCLCQPEGCWVAMSIIRLNEPNSEVSG